MTREASLQAVSSRSLVPSSFAPEYDTRYTSKHTVYAVYTVQSIQHSIVVHRSVPRRFEMTLLVYLYINCIRRRFVGLRSFVYLRAGRRRIWDLLMGDG